MHTVSRELTERLLRLLAEAPRKFEWLVSETVDNEHVRTLVGPTVVINALRHLETLKLAEREGGGDRWHLPRCPSPARGRRRRWARALLGRAVAAGVLRNPSGRCEGCRAPYAGVYHPGGDYSRPFAVKWWCRGCANRSRSAAKAPPPTQVAAMPLSSPTVEASSVASPQQWEQLFDDFCEREGLDRVYEPVRLTLSTGESYVPDFFVESPLGPCFVELHRLVQIHPGDEPKIAKLRLAVDEVPRLTGAPLILLGEREVGRLRRALLVEAYEPKPRAEPRRGVTRGNGLDDDEDGWVEVETAGDQVLVARGRASTGLLTASWEREGNGLRVEVLGVEGQFDMRGDEDENGDGLPLKFSVVGEWELQELADFLRLVVERACRPLPPALPLPSAPP